MTTRHLLLPVDTDNLSFIIFQHWIVHKSAVFEGRREMSEIKVFVWGRDLMFRDETHLPVQLESKRHRNQMTQLHEVVEIVKNIPVSYIHKDPQWRESDPATVCSWKTYHVI